MTDAADPHDLDALRAGYAAVVDRLAVIRDAFLEGRDQDAVRMVRDLDHANIVGARVRLVKRVYPAVVPEVVRGYGLVRGVFVDRGHLLLLIEACDDGGWYTPGELYSMGIFDEETKIMVDVAR